MCGWRETVGEVWEFRDRFMIRLIKEWFRFTFVVWSFVLFHDLMVMMMVIIGIMTVMRIGIKIEIISS